MRGQKNIPEQLKLADFEDKSLLILDDDDPLRGRLARAMEKKGFQVKEAKTVSEGLNIVKTSPPGFACVDLRLEDGNGLDVVKELSKNKSDCRIVMLTGQNIIKQLDKENQFIVDPHTATGFAAAKKIDTLEDIIVLGTAHPYKFNDTIEKVTGKNLEVPEHLKKYIDKKEKFDIIGNSNSEVKKYILSKIK